MAGRHHHHITLCRARSLLQFHYVDLSGTCVTSDTYLDLCQSLLRRHAVSRVSSCVRPRAERLARLPVLLPQLDGVLVAVAQTLQRGHRVLPGRHGLTDRRLDFGGDLGAAGGLQGLGGDPQPFQLRLALPERLGQTLRTRRQEI